VIVSETGPYDNHVTVKDSCVTVEAAVGGASAIVIGSVVRPRTSIAPDPDRAEVAPIDLPTREPAKCGLTS
jgi:hypothetical protein